MAAVLPPAGRRLRLGNDSGHAMRRYLVTLLLAFMGALYVADAHAQFSPIPRWNYQGTCQTAGEIQAACDAFYRPTVFPSGAPSPYTGAINCTLGSGSTWNVHLPRTDMSAPGQLWTTFTASSCSVGCPSNSTLSGGSCTCNSGYVVNGTNDGCVAPSAEQQCQTLVDGGNATWPSVDWTAEVSGPGSLEFCSGNCQVRAQGATYYQQGGTWRGSFHAPYALVAATCSLSAPTGASAASAPQTCPVGQCPGSFNGVEGCYPCAGATSTSTTTTVSTPVSASGVQGTPTTTTQTSSTTCQNGACTTTTTTTTSTPGSGGTTTTSTTTTPQRPAGGASGPGSGLPGDDPCVQNPSGAGCGGVPATIGSLYEPKVKTFDSVLAGFATGIAATPLGSGVGNFFTVSAGGSCPTWTFDIEYLSMSYVMDVWCLPWATTALSMMGAALMVVAGFFAFRTVME